MLPLFSSGEPFPHLVLDDFAPAVKRTSMPALVNVSTAATFRRRLC